MTWLGLCRKSLWHWWKSAITWPFYAAKNPWVLWQSVVSLSWLRRKHDLNWIKNQYEPGVSDPLFTCNSWGNCIWFESSRDKTLGKIPESLKFLNHQQVLFFISKKKTSFLNVLVFIISHLIFPWKFNIPPKKDLSPR